MIKVSRETQAMRGPDGPSSAMRGLDGGEPQKYVTSCLQLRSFFYSVVARNELVVVWCGDPVECGIWLREGLKDWLTDLGLIPNVIVLRLSSNVFKIFITYLFKQITSGIQGNCFSMWPYNQLPPCSHKLLEEEIFTSCWFQTKCNRGAKGYDSLGYCFIGLVNLY